MRYISVDIETTGLNTRKHQILEVGMIDSQTRDTFHTYVEHDEYYGDPYALYMNAEILRKLAVKEPPYTYTRVEQLPWAMSLWFQKLKLDPNQGINLAGKNPAGFDMQFFLSVHSFRGEGGKLFIGQFHFRQRVLDPAILYWELGDNCLPDLKTCCKRSGIPYEKAHTAVADAEMVMKLLLNKGI